MVTATGPHTASALQVLDDDLLKHHSALLGGGEMEPKGPTATESDLDRGAYRVDPRRDIIDRWGAALARGDGAEVDRLVQQSRIDRAWVVASGQLVAMLGRGASTELDDRTHFSP